MWRRNSATWRGTDANARGLGFFPRLRVQNDTPCLPGHGKAAWATAKAFVISEGEWFLSCRNQGIRPGIKVPNSKGPWGNARFRIPVAHLSGLILGKARNPYGGKAKNSQRGRPHHHKESPHRRRHRRGSLRPHRGPDLHFLLEQVRPHRRRPPQAAPLRADRKDLCCTA
jgi:hypothetical protein